MAKHQYLAKGGYYYLKLPQGFIRVLYVGVKEGKRRFNMVNGKMQFLLDQGEAQQLVARVPKTRKKHPNIAPGWDFSKPKGKAKVKNVRRK